MPNHSTFSKSRLGRFRESDAFRYVFERVLQRCIDEGLVAGEGFAVDASVIKADASRWYEEFYRVESSPTLFGADEERVVKASMATIGRYFVERLESVFAGVVREPGILRNSSNNPLYLLCFAVGNARGKDIALRIAGHLLRDLR